MGNISAAQRQSNGSRKSKSSNKSLQTRKSKSGGKLNLPSDAEIQQIEFLITELNRKLKKEVGGIDQYIKNRILSALSGYSNVMFSCGQKFGKHNLDTIQEKITNAKNRLTNLSSIQGDYHGIDLLKMDEVLSYVTKIKEDLDSNKIKNYEQVLRTVAFYAKMIQHEKRIKITDETDSDISILILKLYVKTTGAVSIVMKEVLDNLDYICDDIDIKEICDDIDIKEIDQFIGQVQKKLEKIENKKFSISTQQSKVKKRVEGAHKTTSPQTSQTSDLHTSSTFYLDDKIKDTKESKTASYASVLKRNKNETEAMNANPNSNYTQNHHNIKIKPTLSEGLPPPAKKVLEPYRVNPSSNSTQNYLDIPNSSYNGRSNNTFEAMQPEILDPPRKKLNNAINVNPSSKFYTSTPQESAELQAILSAQRAKVDVEPTKVATNSSFPHSHHISGRVDVSTKFYVDTRESTQTDYTVPTKNQAEARNVSLNYNFNQNRHNITQVSHNGNTNNMTNRNQKEKQIPGTTPMRTQAPIKNDSQLRRSRETLQNGSTPSTNKTENMNAKNEYQILNAAETKLFTAINNVVHFKDKKSLLEEAVQLVDQINVNSAEISSKKNTASIKIEGFLIAENMDHLRQLKKSADHHKEYAQQFSFPISFVLYKTKRDEIGSLKEVSNSLSVGRRWLDARKQIVEEQIDEALNILEKRATLNEHIVSSLTYLDKLEIHVINERSKSLTNLNLVRQELNSIRAYHHRVYSRRMEVINKLHSLEENLYTVRYPSEITEIKLALNQCEKKIDQLLYSDSNEGQDQLKEEILGLWNIMKVSLLANYSEDETRVLRNNFSIVWEYFSKVTTEINSFMELMKLMNTIKNNVMALSAQNISSRQKSHYLKAYQEQLKVNEKFINRVESLRVFQDLQTEITTAFFGLKLMKIGNALNEIERKLSQPNYSRDIKEFKKLMDEVFYLKEYVEDAPEGIPQIESQVKVLSPKIKNILFALNDDVANFVTNKKPAENILELRSSFEILKSNSFVNVPRDNIAHVEKIYEKAQYFEDHIKNYLGSDSSTDYYVIEETLTLLLETLDTIDCSRNQDMLPSVIEAMNYIKKLMEQLNSNASSD